jgi:hypothetical protein
MVSLAQQRRYGDFNQLKLGVLDDPLNVLRHSSVDAGMVGLAATNAP